MARYTLLEENRSVLAAMYQLLLPTEDELRAELQRERARLEMERGRRLTEDGDCGAR